MLPDSFGLRYNKKQMLKHWKKNSGRIGCRNMNQNILGFYANTKMLEQEEVFRHFFCSLSKERQQKLDVIKAEGVRLSSLGAWTLMDYGLRQLYGLRQKDVTITYGAHGKPYVKDRPDIHFNLSHSGDYVLAAFGPVEIGCDIQQTMQGTRNDRIATRFFTEAEQKALAEGIDFYRIWARKESYIKCTGNGMACDLRSFDVTGDMLLVQEVDVCGLSNCNGADSEQLREMIFFADHELPGYEMAVCYENSGELPVVWQEVNFDDWHQSNG